MAGTVKREEGGMQLKDQRSLLTAASEPSLTQASSLLFASLDVIQGAGRSHDEAGSQ